jgi:acetyl-CoA carboxylase biotin carboxyl carrier protein
MLKKEPMLLSKKESQSGKKDRLSKKSSTRVTAQHMWRGSEMEHNEFTINAPLSGTFYRRPSPEDDPYVEVGNHINKGTVVCIVETMKIFNEVRSEKEGIVKEILIEDEEPVLTGQPMIRIEAI